MSSDTPSSPCSELDAARAEIDRIDADLVALIAERVRTASRCGPAKARAHLALVDVAREASVVRRAATTARSLGLDPEPVRGIFRLLIEQARRAQASPARPEDPS